MKLIKNKLLNLSIICTLLFTIGKANAETHLEKFGRYTINSTYWTTKIAKPIAFGLLARPYALITIICATGVITGNLELTEAIIGLCRVFASPRFFKIHLLIKLANLSHSKISEIYKGNFNLFGKNSYIRFWILEIAFKNNNIEEIKELFNKQDDINAEYSLGYRPIDYACKYNNTEILKWLIDEKRAAIKSEIKTLGEGGNDIEQSYLTSTGNIKDPFKIAANNNSSGAFKLLLEKNTDQNFLNTVKNDACISIDIKTIEYLVANTIEIDIRLIFSRISLGDVNEKELLEILKLLIENGIITANTVITKYSGKQESPLSLSTRKNFPKLVQYLLDNGASTDDHGFFPNRIIDNKYIQSVYTKNTNLYTKVIKLDYVTEKDNSSTKEISTRINVIKKLFNDREIPLYAKQNSILFLVELYKSNQKFKIKFDDIKQLYKKIEFNYTFINDKNFKTAVEFALANHDDIEIDANKKEKTISVANNCIDINGKSILEAIANYDHDQNYLNYAFENKQKLYDEPNLIKHVLAQKSDPRKPLIINVFVNKFIKAKNLLIKLKNKFFRVYDIDQDYSDTWDNLKKNGKNKELKGFIRRPIVMHELNKIKTTKTNDKGEIEIKYLPNVLVGKIIGYGV